MSSKVRCRREDNLGVSPPICSYECRSTLTLHGIEAGGAKQHFYLRWRWPCLFSGLLDGQAEIVPHLDSFFVVLFVALIVRGRRLVVWPGVRWTLFQIFPSDGQSVEERISKVTSDWILPSTLTCRPCSCPCYSSVL